MSQQGVWLSHLGSPHSVQFTRIGDRVAFPASATGPHQNTTQDFHRRAWTGLQDDPPGYSHLHRVMSSKRTATTFPPDMIKVQDLNMH